ncbi:hypothetical protein MHB40_20445 [Lysinibacillus sp. FSL K6-0057]|uniref:hypothetical protein n=1 Tax=Lysinibacillus sp. FSL K6-0057 TaxID=2921411 RepID=UPI00315998C2
MKRINTLKNQNDEKILLEQKLINVEIELTEIKDLLLILVNKESSDSSTTGS